MSEPRRLFELARGLLLPLAALPLLVVPFVGGCAIVLSLDRAGALALAAAVAMAVSIVGNVVVLRFIVTAGRPGTVAKIIMVLLSVLDFGFAVGLVMQSSGRGPMPLILGAAFAVKGVLALVFAFVRRPDEPPSFPTLRP